MGLRWTEKDFDGVVELRRQLRQIEAEIENRTPANISGTALSGLSRIGTRPPAPTGVQVTPATGRLLLTWGAVNVADLARYEVQIADNIGFGAAETFSTANTFFTYEKAITGTTYYLRVRALNTAGTPSVYSNIVSTAPKAVTSVEAPIASTSPIDLVSSLTITSVTPTIDFTGLTNTAYDLYRLDFYDLVIETGSGKNLDLRFFMDATLKSDAKYDDIRNEMDAGPTHGQTAGTTNTQIRLNRGTSQHGTTGGNATGSIWFVPNPTTSLHPTMYFRYSFFDSGGTFTTLWGSGRYDNAVLGGSWDGFRLFWSTGENFNTGAVFMLYGHRQSV